MKGLPHKCCLCECDIKNKNSIMLLCSCLVTICKDCGIKQLSEHVNTYHSYIQCPICLNQENDSMNKIIQGVKEADDYQNELYEQACNYFKIPKKASKTNIKRYFNDYFALLMKYRDELNYVIQGYEEYYIDPSVLCNINCKDRIDQLCLLVTRLECYRQLQIPQKPIYASDLPLGPLSKISFATNYTLEGILLERNTNHRLLSNQQEESIDAHCILCAISPLTNKTTLSLCSCKYYFCQMCVRKSISNATEIDKDSRNAVFIKCPSCLQLLIRLYDIPDFFLYRDQLIDQMVNNLGEKKQWTKKSKEDRDILYQFYCNLFKEINPFGKLKSYHDFMPKTYTTCKESKEMCLLELSRMEIERQHRLSFHILPSTKTEKLPLGPLNRLTIKPNIFLEAFAALLSLGGAVDVDNDDIDEDFDLAASLSKQYFDPNAKIDEASEKVVKHVFIEKGGELSVEQLDDIIALNRANKEEEITLKHIVRQSSTPCPYCSCNPYCLAYLAKHLHNRHANCEGVEMLIEESLALYEEDNAKESRIINKNTDHLQSKNVNSGDVRPKEEEIQHLNPSELIATTKPQAILEDADAISPTTSVVVDFFHRCTSNEDSNAVIVDHFNVATTNESQSINNHSSDNLFYLDYTPTPAFGDEAIVSYANNVPTNPITSLPNITGSSRIKKKSSLNINYSSDEDGTMSTNMGAIIRKENNLNRSADSKILNKNNKKNSNNNTTTTTTNNNNNNIEITNNNIYQSLATSISSTSNNTFRKRINTSKAKDFFHSENNFLLTDNTSATEIIHSKELEQQQTSTKQSDKPSILQLQKPTMSKVEIANMKSKYNYNLAVPIPEELLGYFTKQELQLRNLDISPEDLIVYAPVPSLYHYIDDDDDDDETHENMASVTAATSLSSQLESALLESSMIATTTLSPDPTLQPPTSIDSKQLEENIRQLEMKEEERIELQKGFEYAFIFEINDYNLSSKTNQIPQRLPTSSMDEPMNNKQAFNLVIKYPKGALRYELHDLTDPSTGNNKEGFFSFKDYKEKKITLKCYNWKLLSVQTCLKLANHRLIGSVKAWRSTKNVYLNCRKDFESYGIVSNSTVWLVNLDHLKSFFSKTPFNRINNVFNDHKQLKIELKEELNYNNTSNDNSNNNNNSNNNDNIIIKQEQNQDNNIIIKQEPINNITIKQEPINNIIIKKELNIINQSSERNRICNDPNDDDNNNNNNEISMNELKPWERANFKKKRKVGNKTSLPYTTTTSTAAANPNSNYRTIPTTALPRFSNNCHKYTVSRNQDENARPQSSRFTISTSILANLDCGSDDQDDEYKHVAIKVENSVDRRSQIYNNSNNNNSSNNNNNNNNSSNNNNHKSSHTTFKTSRTTDNDRDSNSNSHYDTTTTATTSSSVITLTEVTNTMTSKQLPASTTTTALLPTAIGADTVALLPTPIVTTTSSRFSNTCLASVLDSSDDSDNDQKQRKKAKKCNNNITKRENILSMYSQSQPKYSNSNIGYSNNDNRSISQNNKSYNNIRSNNHINNNQIYDRDNNNKYNNQSYSNHGRTGSKENYTSDSSRYQYTSSRYSNNTVTNSSNTTTNSNTINSNNTSSNSTNMQQKDRMIDHKKYNHRQHNDECRR